MHVAERELGKACERMAKWYRDRVRFRKIADGFLLSLNMEGEMIPTIGVSGQNLVGAQDDFDIFLDLLGYEAQVERVLFDPSKVKFILDAGWSGKYWRKPAKDNIDKSDLVVDAIGARLPSKISALAICFIAAVGRERRHRFTHPFSKRSG